LIVGTTFFAQVVLTLRVYAVTSKNRIITSFLCAITISELILGLHITRYAATHAPVPLIADGIPVYMLCVVWVPSEEAVAFSAVSLVYGTKLL